MAINSASTYLKYANLQMAAEALLDDPESDRTRLTTGNNRSSRFTDVLADQFIADGWTVLEHKPDTPTGFSGTLFKNTQTGDLVMSFRSTEFADDAARDNEATNALEIKPFGWAFGQIADMEDWYAKLKADGTIKSTDSFAVTGYSLGGHLATAFNLLHGNELASTGSPVIEKTYTFNGAGVGELVGGVQLSQVISQFASERNQSHANYFQTAEATQLYTSLTNLMHNGSATGISEAFALTTSVRNAAYAAPPSTAQDVIRREVDLIFNAVDRARRVFSEAQRVAAGISSGGTSSGAQAVDTSQIAATKLDYQLAVLRTQQATRPYASGLLDGIGLAYAADRAPLTLPGASPIYDLYGAPLPSAVSNSQHHYGAATPIFIEDQPLLRGNIVTSAVWNSLRFGEAKLLVDGFANNDFGDTHSLVLLVDSLSVQNLLATLDPSVDASVLNTVLQAASNAKAQAAVGQGYAEGDTLEHTLDGLRRMLLGPSVTDTPAKMAGGTWADIADRNVFYANLKQLTDSPQYKSLIGKVSIGAAAGDSGLPTRARTEFTALVSLLTLSPLTLKVTDAAGTGAIEATLGNVWVEAYAGWQADKSDVAAGRTGTNFTDTWLYDRQSLLQWKEVLGLSNETSVHVDANIRNETSFVDMASDTRFDIVRSKTPPNIGWWSHVVFGSDVANAIVGDRASDDLYGGAGADTLSGLGGADYLEGNAGNDQLDGGAGDDFLLGGSGSDTFIVQADNGVDTVLDSDPGDRIQLDGRLLNGSGEVKSSSTTTTVWLDESVPTKPVVFLYDALASTLTIAGSGSTVVVNNFVSGDMGISVPVLPTQAPPVFDTLYDLVVGAEFDRWTNDNFTNLPQADRVKNANAVLPNATSIVVKIEGRVGNDILEGGSTARTGRIQITGGSGDDKLFAGSYQTLAEALAAQTTIATNTSTELLDGGAGNDQVFGAAGDDALFGGDGNDTLLGGAGRDIIFSDGDAGWGFKNDNPAGNRWVGNTPGEGPFFIGAAYVGQASGRPSGNPNGLFQENRYLQGPVGLESVDYGALAQLQGFSLAGDSGYAEVLDPVFDGVATEAGPRARDAAAVASFNTNRWAGSDVVYAGAGDDFVNAGGGNDFVDAGTGNDIVAGYSGNDVIYGQDGDDLLMGDFTALSSTADAKELGNTTVKRFWLDARLHGNDFIDGGAGADAIEGGGGADWLLGGAGDDRLYGDFRTLSDPSGNAQGIVPSSIESYAGADHLEGGDGNDMLEGDAGDDVLMGGTGDDTLYGDSGLKTWFSGAGADTLDGGDGNDVLLGEGGDDVLAGGAGNDWLAGEDQQATNAASSLPGNDALSGGAGIDTLIGGNGDDLLDGGTGDDLLFGGAGRDSLRGGAGIDGLAGGAGDDTYYFSAADIALSGGVAERISDTEGANVIVFEGQSSSTAGVARNAGTNDLVLSTDAQHAVVIQDGLSGSVQSFAFADRTLTAAQLIFLIAANDSSFRSAA